MDCLCCVVSAQGQGLLCEVPRSAKDDNVKYIGYCNYHYKKMVCSLLSWAYLSSGVFSMSISVARMKKCEIHCHWTKSSKTGEQ